jgi:predicted DNA-binding protein
VKTHDSQLTLRVPKSLETRLEQAADTLGMAKNALARQGIEAAVEAVENHAGKLVVPLEFSVKYVPIVKK